MATQVWFAIIRVISRCGSSLFIWRSCSECISRLRQWGSEAVAICQWRSLKHMAFLGVNLSENAMSNIDAQDLLKFQHISTKYERMSDSELSSAIVPSPSVQELFLKVVVPGVVHLSFRLLVLILQVLDLCRLKSQVEPFQFSCSTSVATKSKGFLVSQPV